MTVRAHPDATLVPDVFLVGAHRAGTTTLCELLDRHPSIQVSRPKEPGVLRRDKSLEAIERAYQRCFPEWSPGIVRLEGSTVYSQSAVYPGVASRIARLNPAARVIYSLREPLRRIESAWVQYRSERRVDIPADFNRAVREVPELVDASLYWKQLGEYRAVLPDERILLIFFDDLVADPNRVVATCLEFLGLEPIPVPREGVARNRSADKRQEAGALRLLRRSAALERLNEATRRSGALRAAKAWLRDRTSRPIPTPRWDRETLEWARAQVEPDTAALAAHLGGLPGSWAHEHEVGGR